MKIYFNQKNQLFEIFELPNSELISLFKKQSTIQISYLSDSSILLHSLFASLID